MKSVRDVTKELLDKAKDSQLEEIIRALDLSTKYLSRNPDPEKKKSEILDLAEQQGGTTLARLEEILCKQNGLPKPLNWIYFSCSEADRIDPHCWKFFKDLTDRLKELGGEPSAGEIRFFDEGAGGNSEEWFPWSLRAMQQCHALVCLFSKPYLSSLYCGRVWQAFRQRLQPAAAPAPPPIFQVRWKAIDKLTLRPRSVDELQLKDWFPPPPYDEAGLQALIQQVMANRDNSRQVYDDFVNTLARQIISTIREHPLPEDTTVPFLKEIETAFVSDWEPSEQQKGPESATFVFVAARKSEIRNRRSGDAYGEDPKFWRPYYTTSANEAKQLWLITQQEVTNAEIMISSLAVIYLDEKFEENFNTAHSNGNIILAVIDPWTLFLNQYAQYLSAHRQKFLESITILVCLNAKDEESIKQRQVLLNRLDRVFEKVNLLPADRVRAEIKSEPDLRNALIDALRSSRRMVVDNSPPRPAQGLKFIKPDIIVSEKATDSPRLVDYGNARRAEAEAGEVIRRPELEPPRI